MINFFVFRLGIKWVGSKDFAQLVANVCGLALCKGRHAPLGPPYMVVSFVPCALVSTVGHPGAWNPAGILLTELCALFSQKKHLFITGFFFFICTKVNHVLATALSLGKDLPISAFSPSSLCHFMCQAINIVMLDILGLNTSLTQIR